MKALSRIVASSACALGLAATPALGADQFINVLTGGTSGVYYPLGVALAGSIGRAIPGSKTSVQATKASVENLNLLQAGRGEIAFTLGDSLSDAWKGNEDAGFKTPLKKLRGIAAIYPNYIQIVARADSGIKSLADLKGKKTNDPAYLPATIPANTYRGQTADVPAAAVQNYLVTHDGVGNDTVYAMTKALWTNLDQLTAAHAAAKAIDQKKALEGMPVPL